MPFDEEEDLPTIQSQKIGLKQVSSKKSIFDKANKKPSVEEFEQKVHKIQSRMSAYKKRASDLALSFNKMMADKTLKDNKNVFALEMEKEVLTNMIQLASEINNDQQEQAGMGSLSWITLLLKTCLSQRDKINNLEYELFLLNKKIEGLDTAKDNG